MSNDLMAKLAVSKKIMDRHQVIPRGNASGTPNYNTPMVENYEAVPATYNIPQEYASESALSEVRQPELPTQDRILNSKLPDEIKKLMIEHPIQQPSSMGGSVLSDEVIAGATRLMGNNKPQPKQQSQPIMENSDLKQMIRDVVRDTVRDVVREELQSAGLLSESSQNTNEVLSLRVGKHIFEGKVLKIKKLKQ